MRWGRLIKDVEDWFDLKIVPILGEDKIGLGKVKEEYKELKKAHEELEEFLLYKGGTKEQLRILERHVEGEAADLFIALLCYCHANDINLKRAVYATLLKLQKRKWKKSAVPGVVRHVEGT